MLHSILGIGKSKKTYTLGCLGLVGVAIVICGLITIASVIAIGAGFSVKNFPAREVSVVERVVSTEQDYSGPAETPQGQQNEETGFQVGPWRQPDGNLYLNMLFPGSCPQSVSMTIDGRSGTATLITTGALKRFDPLPIDGVRGESCNYRLSRQPQSSFTVSDVKYPLDGGNFHYSQGAWTYQ